MAPDRRLTALLIGIGALIGGMFLSALVVLAAAMNVVGYWFSDRIALEASRAKPVEPGTRPDLEAMVEDLAGRAMNEGAQAPTRVLQWVDPCTRQGVPLARWVARTATMSGKRRLRSYPQRKAVSPG